MDNHFLLSEHPRCEISSAKLWIKGGPIMTRKSMSKSLFSRCLVLILATIYLLSSSLTASAATLDTTAPVITITGVNPAEVVVGSVYIDAGATATDDLDISVVVDADVSNVDSSLVGSYTVTYTAADTGENRSTATRTVNVIPKVVTGISVTALPTKTTYTVGQSLNITGLVVTGSYNHGGTELVLVTAANISGFDSSHSEIGQVLTVTVDGKTATFDVNIISKYVKKIKVASTNNITQVDVGGSLQMIATVTPFDATYKSVAWSVTPGTGTAAIDQSGLLTGQTAGTVSVVATAKDSSVIKGSLIINVISDASITSIADISVTVKQNDKYVLPTKVAAVMSDGTTQDITVKWVPVNANTGKIGVYTFIGTVTGYSGKVNLTLIVSQVINFPDANLEQAIREQINKPTGDIFRSDVENVTSLYALDKDIKDISGIEYLTNLQELVLGIGGAIHSGNQIGDISALAGLTNLQRLDLGNTRVLDGTSTIDISALGGLINLQWLGVNGTNISDISALTGLTKLQYIDMGGNQISDISALAGLSNLAVLAIGYNQISDISALAGLTNLQSLNLDQNQISDISVFAGLTNLKALGLSGMQISDISALAGLTDLRFIGLQYNQISDISALAGLTNLQSLNLDQNQISDISALAGLTNLRELAFSSNSQISDISVLASLTNLEALGLGGMQISDISALAGLSNLRFIGLQYNQISDISALTGMTNLQQLALNGNPISDADIQSLKTALPDCSIDF